MNEMRKLMEVLDHIDRSDHLGLEYILNSPIVGNAYHDRVLLDSIDQFLLSTANSMDQKVIALQKLDDTMGLGNIVDEIDVEDYLRNR